MSQQENDITKVLFMKNYLTNSSLKKWIVLVKINKINLETRQGYCTVLLKQK